MRVYSAGVRYCAGSKFGHNIDPSIVVGFYIVRVPGIWRIIFRDTYLHNIWPPTVRGSLYWVASDLIVLFQAREERRMHQQIDLAHRRVTPGFIFQSYVSDGSKNYVRCDVRVYHVLVCSCFFPGVFLSFRVTGACPVTTDLIMRGNVKATTTTTTTTTCYINRIIP